MKTLLMVEDEAEIRTLMRFVLDKHFLIIEASDGAKALAMARVHQPDLILMDVILPVMDGITAVQRLKAMECTRDIPVVFVSSMVMCKDVERGYEAGAVDYITKPFNILELPDRLKRALKKGVGHEK